MDLIGDAIYEEEKLIQEMRHKQAVETSDVFANDTITKIVKCFIG